MKRFITYLYIYTQGEKGRNIGFVKTDIRNEECRMEFHLQGIENYEGEVSAYLVTNESWGHKVFDGYMAGGRCDGLCSFAPEAIFGKKNGFEDVEGIGICFGEKYYAAGSWVDVPGERFCLGDFRRELVAEKENTEAVKIEDTPKHDFSEEKWNEVQRAENMTTEETAVEAVVETAVETATETAVEMAVEQEADLQREKQKMVAAREYQRIDIVGIKNLPKCNWYLCNNSFVIHGFFNYKYLVIKTVEKDGVTKKYLGVPGLFEQPEKIMATLFGFPEFEVAEETIQDEEGRPFGYWFCLLDT